MNNRVTVIATFLFVSVLCGFGLRKIDFTQTRNEQYLAYRVQFEYFGMDATVLERMITIPLEEHATSLPALVRMVSTVSWGKSSTTLYFDRTISHTQVYPELRTVVDTIYEKLPKAVQKPRIYSAAAGITPVLVYSISSETMSLSQIRENLEQEIKNKLEAVDGVAEAVIAGGSVSEILVVFDKNIIATHSIYPVSIAESIAKGHGYVPGGSVRTPRQKIPVRMDIRLPKLDDISSLPVYGKKTFQNLESVATIYMKERAPEEITRINGEEGLILSVRPAALANTYQVSKQCRAIIKRVLGDSMDVVVLHDEGSVFVDLLLRLAIALGITLFLTICVVPLFFNSKKIVFLVLWYLPTCIFWSLGFLALLRIPIDQNCIAGIVIAVGLVIDPILVLHEKTNSASVDKKVYINIALSTLTSVIVLLPLLSMDYLVQGIRAVSISVMVMLLVSFCITILYARGIKSENFLESPIIPIKISTAIQRTSCRFLYRCDGLFTNKRRWALILLLLICLGTISIFHFSHKNMSLIENQSYVNFRVEYENERSAEYIEQNTRKILEKIKKIPGVLSIQSESRKGSLEAYVSFSNSTIYKGTLAEKIYSFASLVPEGFLYVPDLGKKETGIQTLEIALCGTESSICCDLVRETVSAISESEKIVQAVVNFKRPERVIVFYPNRKKLALANLTIRQTAEAFRLICFGSVVEKWFEGKEERDIRVRGIREVPLERKKLAQISLAGANSPVMLTHYGRFQEVAIPGRIQRKNGQRSAWFTVHVRSESLGEASKIVCAELNKKELPIGYFYSFPEELDAMNQSITTLFIVFCFTIIALIIVLIALIEEFFTAVLVVLSIPVSVFVPLLFRFILRTPIQTGDILGMVIVSGVCINNVIYIVGQNTTCIKVRLRKRMKSLFATTLTTVAGAAPMALLSKGSFTASLAYFILWGTAASLGYTLVLFPVLVVPNRRRKDDE